MAAKFIKNYIKSCTVFLFAFYLSACNQKKQNDTNTQQDAAQVATLVCESRELTHKKFALAEEYQQLNSPNKKHPINQADSAHVKLDREKESIIKMSQAKSDSVNHLLKTLWVTKYQTKEQKKQFDDAMEAELKKQCPLSAP